MADVSSHSPFANGDWDCGAPMPAEPLRQLMLPRTAGFQFEAELLANGREHRGTISRELSAPSAVVAPRKPSGVHGNVKS
jgi:hypothetical protein